jgi:cysteine-S-conjugate beta-lyase
MMLCNPQNPVGRVWSEEELKRLGDIAIKNDVTIISDEIHGDLTLKGAKHTPMASISKELAERTITLMAPSKTFNIAGLVTSIAIIPNKELRDIYTKAIEAMEIDSTSIFGALALEVAYNEGKDWLDQVMEYIESNMDYAVDYIEKNIPGVKAYKPEGTFLLWLDFRDTKKSADEVQEALLNTGKVILNDGRPYGTGSDGYFRLNVACPRTLLEDGLERIEKAVRSL